MSAVPAMVHAGAPGTVEPWEWTPERTDELRSFVGDVLPAAGSYVLATKTAGGMRQDWYESPGALIDAFLARGDAPDVYYGTAAYDGRRARKRENVVALRAHRIDIDCGAAKAFDSQKAALRALRGALFRGLPDPTYVVSSGNGLHLYWCLSADVSTEEWQPGAELLHAACEALGLHPDPAVTTDTARILRLPGSLNGKSGTRAAILAKTEARYDPVDFAQRLRALVPDATPFVRPTGDRAKATRPLNADVLDDGHPYPPAQFPKIAAGCAAVAEATRGNGARASEPLWRGVLGVIKHCADADKHAHEASRGHADYDPAETQAKLARWDAGPTTCEYFGPHALQACASCEHRGRIKSPIVLGRPTVQEVNAQSDPERPAAPAWVAVFNARFTLVRHGADMRVLDNQTPVSTAEGPRRGCGWLTLAAFRQAHAGQFVSVVGRDGNAKTIPAADAWLSHPQRAQKEGTDFAPGADLGPSILNLYEGWGVEPAAGDVEPWLHVLRCMVPDKTTRDFLLNLLAWKVQNPGGVPGVIPILTGGKGTGKNSVMEPLVRAFGVHGAVFDDSEQVAGRFTGHLRTLALAVLDEAIFTGDSRQMDRIKSRVTATTMTYEAKGRDPISGVNRCMYVSLTNHAHVWQATLDERRAVIVECEPTLQGDHDFWRTYWSWIGNGGSAALLHYLLHLDISGFNVRQIPKTAALQRQVEMTALRNPAAGWWHSVLSEGSISCGDGGPSEPLEMDAPSQINKETLRRSFMAHAGRNATGWATAMRQLREWLLPDSLREIRVAAGAGNRQRRVELPPLRTLRERFAAATGISEYGWGD